MAGTIHNLEVNPQIPQRLARLEELANNLWYSWDLPTRALFATLSKSLWKATSRNPKALLRRVDQKDLEAAAANPAFLDDFERVLSAFDAYQAAPAMGHALGPTLKNDDLVAYFCAEFGFHESLPIYSGGLGILAADYCKAASDTGLPFIGVGLLYRQGYFHQSIDADGRQHATYNDSDFDTLPISPVLGADGKEMRVGIELPEREVKAKVWQAQIGRGRVILLDTCLPENSARDRDITRQLYIGDRSSRIEQEILLGVGGVRALEALGLKPTVWHVNEGHSAFLILERIRSLVSSGLPFAAALEAVASNVVFTTHTAVAAGHERFAEQMIRNYFAHWSRTLGSSYEQLLALGMETGKPEFDMTVLAIRGSRHQNGVSRIHGDISSQIARHHWPQIEPAENPMTYVTNGIHVPTFLAREWHEIFGKYLGVDWRERLTDPSVWKGIDQIPDDAFWQVRRRLKCNLLFLVCDLVREQHLCLQGSPAHVDRLLKFVDPANSNVLTIGFARRFATYKRAALLFHDPDRLKAIISHAGRPVLILFAGTAHPDDLPGQELIHRINEMSCNPAFEGHILFLSGYDLHLSRRLVAGADVWLNNPIYPLEASGTSGMKAAINGAINLSVLDGWWGEGHDDKDAVPNGWAIRPAFRQLDLTRRDAEEARSLYEILEDQVLPTYYRHGPLGYSSEWVAMSKRSIATIAPKFNVIRMMREYEQKFYLSAAQQGRRYAADHHAAAREMADWKSRIHAAWAGVRLRRVNTPTGRAPFGRRVRIEIGVYLNRLKPQDITVEALFAWPVADHPAGYKQEFTLAHMGAIENGEDLFFVELAPEHCGKLEYRIRAFPSHPLLSHKFEIGLMVWL